MSSKNKPHYTNALTSQDMQEKAVRWARSTLKAQGIDYPLVDADLSLEDNYGRLLSFSEQEAALVVQFMRAPSGPRPIVLDTTNQKEWKGYND